MKVRIPVGKLLCLMAGLVFLASATCAVAGGNDRIVDITPDLLAGIETVMVEQPEDAIFGRPVTYEAYPLSALLIRAFPDWKSLISQNSQLIFHASRDYKPSMPFSLGFSGRAYVTRKVVGRSEEDPYPCWTEGGERHCNPDYFIIWTDGVYPERVQPWGTFALEVVDFEEAYAATIPQTQQPDVLAGFNLYRKYCLECHRINFVGSGKATEHVVRDYAVDTELLDYFLYAFRKNDPTTYMPDFESVISQTERDQILEYLRYMAEHQNICHGAARPQACDAPD